MEYTEMEKIVNPDDGEGGWVDTHPNSDVLVEGSATAEMASEEKVCFISLSFQSILKQSYSLTIHRMNLKNQRK